MSFHNKDSWRSKVSEHAIERNPALDDNPSRIDPKRPHEWFIESLEPELFASKKQALQPPYGQVTAGITHANVSQWESTASFQSVPTQFIDRSFGSETERPVNFGNDGSLMRTEGLVDHFEDDISVNLSISHSTEDPETGLSYNGTQKIKGGCIKDSHSGARAQKLSGFHGGNGTDFFPAGQTYNKEIQNVPLMGHVYEDHSQIRSMDSAYEKGANMITIADSYGKGDSSMLSFGGFSSDHCVMPIAQRDGSFDKLYDQSSAQMTETRQQKQVDLSNVGLNQENKSLSDSVPKNKPGSNKPSRKEAPNSFPSNVRSLISTGMLDGVAIKYVAVSREELHGIIKGSGYLCGCHSCNYTKILNAYEFERHAGAKTKHPNNHIYFENGKTIYQIVQELRSTPVSLLFDAIQTVFGAPINQKSFRIWKESFQAATHELQRIYSKDEFS
ncbi:uncharacterized protein LOC116211625 [Punica granatum]|uniref:Uncharacterized protein LOC116211625 n=1 Tax=Punica granatum TaxID=22663 RepID=A0A6P8DWT3_PUNGR|nr:uncharacterized protein LOC116211625 [Punica granatum]